MRLSGLSNRCVLLSIIFGLLLWLLAVVGFKHLVFGAELDGKPLETRIIFDKQTPTIEVWQNMGGYKQKVWDNRPGAMEDASEFVLRPHQAPLVFEDKDNAPVRDRR